MAEQRACLPTEGDSRAQTPAKGVGKNLGLPAHPWFRKDVNRRPPLTYRCPKNSNLIKKKGEKDVSAPGKWQPHLANGTQLHGSLTEATRSQKQDGSQDHGEAFTESPHGSSRASLRDGRSCPESCLDYYQTTHRSNKLNYLAAKPRVDQSHKQEGKASQKLTDRSKRVTRNNKDRFFKN